MGKPVWGTCAGLISLADKATGQKTGGQELIGGLDCTVHQNFFGSQIQSFEEVFQYLSLQLRKTVLQVFVEFSSGAPAILEVGPEVEVLADILVPSGKTIDSNCAHESQEENTGSEKKVIVAVKQGNLLGTIFHPELTADTRWHSYFLKMVSEVEEGTSSCISTSGEHLSFYQQPMSDLPIFQ